MTKTTTDVTFTWGKTGQQLHHYVNGYPFRRFLTPGQFTDCCTWALDDDDDAFDGDYLWTESDIEALDQRALSSDADLRAFLAQWTDALKTVRS
ncbi:MAG: hypothetical protein ABIP03_04965 [Aquihabitans sp.]